MRGGRRPGAGRRHGSTSRMALHAREQAGKAGELPHEFLLRVMRGKKIGQHTPTFVQRLDAAKAAAPYFAPRLATVTPEAPPTKDPIRELLAEIEARNVPLVKQD